MVKMLQKISPLILLLGIVIATIGVVIITPLTRFIQLPGNSYVGPPHLIFPYYSLYALYISLTVTITTIYIYFVKTQFVITKRLNLFLLLGIAVASVMFMYPPIYDPLYYFISGYAWVFEKVNVFQSLVPYYEKASLSFPNIPMIHNYAYGPLWLAISAVLVSLSHSTPLLFILYLRILAVLTLGVLLITSKRQDHTNQGRKMYLFILLNPIVLFFGIPSGSIEFLLSALVVASILLIVKNRTILALIILPIVLFIKISTFPVIILLYLWLLHKVKPSNLVRLMVLAILPVGLYLLITLSLFGFHTNYFQGIREFLNLESTYGLTIQNVIPYAISLITFSPGIHLYLMLFVKYSFLFIYGITFLIFSWQVTRRNYTGTDYVLKRIWLLMWFGVFLTGVAVKPWYYIPPIIISLLLPYKYKFASALNSVLIIISDAYLSLLLVYPSSDEISLLLMVISVLLSAAIPLLVSTLTFRDTENSVINSAIRSWLVKIIPAIR